MKTAITIIVILYISAIEGEDVERAEFNFKTLLPQLGNDVAKKNEKLKTCIRDAGFNALDIEKRVEVAAGRIEKRLAHISDLTKIDECYYPETVEEIRIKWKEYFVNPTCLTTEIPALAEEAMAKKLRKTVNDINRTIISFLKEAKKRAGKRDSVIAMMKCFAYISQDDNLQLNTNQKNCIKDESKAAGIDEVGVLSARGELEMKLERFPWNPTLGSDIKNCKILIAEADVKFTKDEKHFRVDCLSKIVGFEDYAKAFHWEWVKYHLELLRVAGGNKSIATKLRSCYLMGDAVDPSE